MPSADDRAKGRQVAEQLLTVVRAQAAQQAPPTAEAQPVDVAAIVEAISKNNIDMTALVEAVSGLNVSVDNHVDLSGLEKALTKNQRDVDVNVDFDVAALVEGMSALNTDMSAVEKTLDRLADAVEKNNDILSSLVYVAKKPKKITYDNLGRITSVGV